MEGSAYRIWFAVALTVSLFGASFLVQWPAVLTVPMAPILVWTYLRLARREERELEARFGEEYRRYAARVPAVLPRIARSSRPREGEAV